MHRTPQAVTAPGYQAQRVQYEQRKTQSFCDRMLITIWIPRMTEGVNSPSTHWEDFLPPCAVPLYIFRTHPPPLPASSFSGT